MTPNTIDEQLELASKIIGMLVARCRQDETTDHTGFTITKNRLDEHAGKVMEDIKRGVLQPTTKIKGFKI